MSSNISPGDLIFFKSDGSWWDFFIRLASPNYTHVGMAIDNEYFVEASIRGVVKTKFNPAWKNVEVLPLIGASEAQINAAIDLATKHLGEKYSILTGISAGLLHFMGLSKVADKIDTNWTCSEFIAYLIRVGMGIPILPRLALEDILPDALRRMSLVNKEIDYGAQP